MKVLSKLSPNNSFKIFGLIIIQIYVTMLCQLTPHSAAMARKMDSIASISDIGNSKNSKSERNYLNLEGGQLLLTPDKDIVCGTNEGKIFIGSDATVFITSIAGKTIVYDLAQTAPDRVFVVVNNSKVPMWPGLALVLSSHGTVDFEKLDPNCRGIKYFNQHLVELPNAGVNAYMADFTLSSAMLSISSLRQLISSENNQDKIVVARLLKGAVLAGEHATM